MILPKFIRREIKNIFKFLSAEEQGEGLHRQFNELERVYCTTRDKAKRYFLMKKAYINKMKQGKENLTKETRKKK